MRKRDMCAVCKSTGHSMISHRGSVYCGDPENCKKWGSHIWNGEACLVCGARFVEVWASAEESWRTSRLRILEDAANHPENMIQEGTPSTGICEELFMAGFLDQLEPETFFGGKYRITDKGRVFIDQHSVPAEW